MSYFKVLLLDGIDPAGIDVIKQTGSIEPIVHEKIAREKLLEIVGELLPATVAFAGRVHGDEDPSVRVYIDLCA